MRKTLSYEKNCSLYESVLCNFSIIAVFVFFPNKTNEACFQKVIHRQPWPPASNSLSFKVQINSSKYHILYMSQGFAEIRHFRHVQIMGNGNVSVKKQL